MAAMASMWVYKTARRAHSNWVFPDVPGDRSNGNCWRLRLGGIPYWKVTIFVGRWGTIDECADVGRPLGWMGELLQRRMGPIRGCRGLEKGGGHGQWSGSAYGGPFRLQCVGYSLVVLSVYRQNGTNSQGFKGLLHSVQCRLEARHEKLMRAGPTVASDTDISRYPVAAIWDLLIVTRGKVYASFKNFNIIARITCGPDLVKSLWERVSVLTRASSKPAPQQNNASEIATFPMAGGAFAKHLHIVDPAGCGEKSVGVTRTGRRRHQYIHIVYIPVLSSGYMQRILAITKNFFGSKTVDLIARDSASNGQNCLKIRPSTRLRCVFCAGGLFRVRRLMYGENKPNTQEVILAHFGKFFAHHVWLNFASECFGLEQKPIRKLWRDYYSYLNHQFGEIMFLIGVYPMHVAILGDNIAALLAGSFHGNIIGFRPL
ncbi:hypothetical protein B0H11DRAFT_1905290 [Mycena galericulata]|nr:hypothetical protein B0H11DRAFT_1905290 [Mycena galericulata]